MTDVSELLRAATADTASPGAVSPNFKALRPNPASMVPTFTPEQKMAAIADVSDPKMAAVAAAADSKKLAMGGMPHPDVFRNAAIARDTGSGLNSSNPIEHDLSTLSADELHAKYGSEAGANLVAGLVRAQNEYRQQQSGTRTTGEAVDDTINQGAVALGKGVLGLGAAGLGLVDSGLGKIGVNSHMGVSLAQATNDFAKENEDKLSPIAQLRNEVSKDQGVLDSRDNEQQSEQDKSNGDGSIVAGLKKFGRGVVQGAKSAASDPVLMTGAAGDAAGSLLAGGVIGKGVGFIGSKLLPTATQKGISLAAGIDEAAGNMSAARLAAAVGSKLPGEEAASLGGMFAGGSYQATAAQIAGMSDEQLATVSPDFREMVSPVDEGGKGMSFEDARNKLANEGGLTAGALAAGAGVVAGKLAKGVLKTPFAAKNLEHATDNIAATTAEQALQGGASQFANNVGVQQAANPDQDLMAGVGEATGSGAVGGLGIGAAMKAPAVAGLGFKAVGRGATAAANARLVSLKNARDKASPISDDKIAAVGADAQAMMQDPATTDALGAAVVAAHKSGASEDAPNESNATGKAMASVADKIEHLGNFEPSELNDAPLPGAVKEKLADSTSRVDMMQRLGAIVNEHGLESEQGAPAAFHLYHEMSKFMELLNSDQAGVDALEDNHAAKPIVDQFKTLAANLAGSPTIRDAVQKITKITQDQADKLVKPVTEDTLGDKQNIDRAATLAAVAPERSNLASVQIILDGYDNGKVKLTADQHAALMSAQAVLGAAKKASDAQAALGHKTPVNSVTNDVMSRENAPNDPQRSASSYAKRIFSLMQAGNKDQAAKELSTFGEFAQHMSNKSDAVNQGYVNGDGNKVSFEARNPVSGQWYDGKAPVVHPKSPESVELAQRVNLEAKQVNDVYNGLSKAFPDLKAGQRKVNDLHENLQGKPADVAQAHRKGNIAQPRVDAPVPGSRGETKVPTIPKETEVQPKVETEQLGKVEKTEATPDAKLQPQAEVTGKGAEEVSKKTDATTGTSIDVEKAPKAQPKELLKGQLKDEGASDKTIRDALSHEMQHTDYTDREHRADLEARLDKLSDKAFVETLEHSYDNKISFSDLKDKSASAVKGLMDSFSKALDKSDANAFIRMVLSGLRANDTTNVGGEFFKDGPVISINEGKLKDFENGKLSPEILSHILSHELAHAIDFRAADGENVMASHGKADFSLDGDLYKEFLAMRDKLTEKESTPLYDYIERQADPATKAQEFFAELGAFVLSKPDLAKELIPNGTKAFHETVAQASERLASRKQVDPRTSGGRDDANRSITAPDTASSRAREPVERVIPKTLKEASPDLVGSKEGNNWFHNAFELAKEGSNRLVGLASPYKALRSALSSDGALERFLGEDKRAASLPAPVSKAYKTYLDHLPLIAKTMEAQLAAKLEKGSNVQKLLDGAAGRWVDGRVLNFAEQRPDGSIGYNKPLLEQSILAALQWALVSDRYKSGMDAQKVQSLTGIKADRANGLVDVLKPGLSPLEATHSLAQKLTDFWGVKVNNNEGIGHTQGIPLAMAAELLEALHGTVLDAEGKPGEQGLLKITRFKVDGDTLIKMEPGEETKARTVMRLKSNLERPTEETKGDSLFAAPSLIEEAVLKEATDRNYHVGDTIPVADKQMNNPLIKNTPEQKDMIGKAQETLHYLDEHTFGLFSALGANHLLTLFGGGNLDNHILNAQHRATLEGKNTSIRSAWEALQDRVSELKTLPEGVGTGIKYAFNVSSIGRLQMLGGQTPQLSKLIREAILPTWSTMNIASDGTGNKENLHFWQLALAQALGVKVHTLSNDAMYEKVHDLISNKFAKSIEMLQVHLVGHEEFSSSKLVEQLQSDFAAAGEDLTPVALKALTEHARWMNASEAERAAFKTSLYVEADGVTNGIVNAIHVFTADHFTKEQIANYAKGGQFFDGTKTMNEHRAKDGKDLYTVMSDHLEKNVDTLRSDVAGTEVESQLDHTMSVLSKLAKGVKYDVTSGDIAVDRGVTKNPGTITTYGAGAKGIAGNIADTMIRKFYEKLSNAAQALHDDPKLELPEALLGKGATEADLSAFENSINTLMTKQTFKTKEGLVLSDTANKPLSFYKMDPEKFAFTTKQFETIQQNLLHLFVTPMREGIASTLGDSLTESTQLVQKAAQVQSIALEHMFRQRIEELQAKKQADSSWNPNDGLSQNEINGILKTLLKQFPAFTPKGQTFLPVGHDTSDLKNTYSASLSGAFRTSPQIHGPSDGGVKSLAMLNVGMGDANMVQKGLVQHDIKNALWVFDGVNLGLDQIGKASEQLNQSAFDAWKGNPIKAVQKSFETFLQNLTPEMLSDNPKMAKAVSDLLGSKSSKDTLDHLQAMQSELAHGAEIVDIRAKVAAEFRSFNDQMAGAQSPHENPGRDLSGMSHEQIADAMNKRVDELLNTKSKRDSAKIELPPEQPTIADMARSVADMQNRAYGEDSRLSELNHSFLQLFSRFMKPDGKTLDRGRYVDVVNTLSMGTDLIKMAEAQGNGFQMTQQAHNTFEHVVSALALNMKLDPNALSAVEQLYRHVTEKLTPAMLENSNDPSETSRQNVALNKYNMLLGNLGTKTDKQGRSSLLSVFLGLSLVDNGLRNVLHGMELPKTKLNDAKTTDAWASNLANKSLDSMADTLSGKGNAKNVRDAIDNLTNRVGETSLDAKSVMEEALLAPNSITNRANDAFVGWMERQTDAIRTKAQSIRDNAQSTTVKRAAEFVNAMAGLVTEKNGALASEGIMSAINRVKGLTPLREVVSDLIGRTKSNGDVYDLIKLTNSMVSKLRQEYRDNLPKFIADQFERQVTKAEWAHMHLGMGKTDLASLRDGRSNVRVLELLADPRERTSEIRKLEAQLKESDPQHFNKMQEKAQQLAEHMTAGKVGTNLLRNAESVAKLNGERVNPKRPNVDPTYVKAVDHLISLYALDKLAPDVQKSLSSLVQSQKKGTEFALNYLVGNRKDEVAKATGMAKYNSLKGHIPTSREQGSSLIVAKDSQSSELLEKSYVRLGDYHGSAAEDNHESKGYYYAPVSGRAAFNQGIMQNAAHTSGGVEIGTGRSQSLNAGRISNPSAVERITKQLAREGNTKENLIPIYNDRGKVVAYDRSFDPARLASVNQEGHLAQALGQWRGRQVEEAMSEEYNKGLIDKTHDMYQESVKAGNEKEYVDLFSPHSYGNDRVIQDAVALMTPETREYAKQVFGDRFMVRRDMLNDTIGYRQATVGDAWTGNSRWSQQTQDGVKNLAMSVFGNKAYQKMVNAETLYKGVVKEAKTLIVVKSIIVPLSNFTSNLFQLAARGVPVTDMIKNMPRKVAEAEAYSKGRLDLLKAEGELRAAEGAQNFNQQLKLKARIQSINDSFKRLSIWPLIKAGEFSAISHADMAHEDMTLMGGKLHDYMDMLVDKLPTSVQTAGRYALITRDTALFQGLQKAVEYGDFLGKAIQYDHYVNKKGFTEAQALARITEEYVNFDRLPGRARGYLDSMGLMWFMNFKLRTTKVALSMIRENPLQALLGSAIPLHHSPIGSIGTPFSDNIVSKAFSGHLGYSLGPGMMLHAPMLNPVAHLLSKM